MPILRKALEKIVGDMPNTDLENKASALLEELEDSQHPEVLDTEINYSASAHSVICAAEALANFLLILENFDEDLEETLSPEEEEEERIIEACLQRDDTIDSGEIEDDEDSTDLF